MKLIINGVIADGTGGDLYAANLLIDDNGRISKIMPPDTPVPDGAEIIDAAGKTVAPGFIDAHSHFEGPIIANPRAITMLCQGCTTIIGGNCGNSITDEPMEYGGYRWDNTRQYLEIFKKVQPALNLVLLSGHSSLRRKVMGGAERLPTPEEAAQMKALLAEDLELGCAGLSFGLIYVPGRYSDTAELLDLASVMKGSGKVLAAHIRSEGDELEAAVAEMLQVAELSGLPFHYSHIKTIHPQNYHKLPMLLEMIRAAHKRGQKVTADRYPYLYSCTGLRMSLPPPYDAIYDIRAFLNESPEHCREVAEALVNSPRALGSAILLFGEYCGRKLVDVAAEMGVSKEVATVNILRDTAGGNTAYLCMSEENMKELIAQDWVCCGSDGLAMMLDDVDVLGHPRSVGTIPRFFRMVADRQGVAEAVRRCSGMAAEIYGIPERGKIAGGYVADLVIFDADKFDSKADYAGNNRYPEGMSKVFVAGNLAYDDEHREKVFPRYGSFLPIGNR